jgi:chaperonin cofactor prefoldin
MIERAEIEQRVAALQQQRDAQRKRLLELQSAVRAADQACAQIDGALAVLEDLLRNGNDPRQ